MKFRLFSGVVALSALLLASSAIAQQDSKNTKDEQTPAAQQSAPDQKPQTELSGTITATVISTGNSLPATAVITAADTQVNNLENLERFEGMRVGVISLTVVAPTQGTITENSATVSSNGVFYAVVNGVPRPFREPGGQKTTSGFSFVVSAADLPCF